MSTPLRTLRVYAMVLGLWASGFCWIGEAWTADPPGAVPPRHRTVGSNMQITLTGTWPSVKVIDLKLIGTGAGFILVMADPPVDFEAALTQGEDGILLDYNLTIGKSDLSGTLLIPPEDLGKPFSIAKLYDSYEIVLTLSRIGPKTL